MSIAEKLTTLAENEQKVYEAGRQAEYDRFWNRKQHNGDRTNYYQAFTGKEFPRPQFDPKYDMYVTNAGYMFAWWNPSSAYGLYFDLDLRDIGVVLDFSACTEFNAAFHTNMQLVAIGTVDTRSASALSTTFYSCRNIHTIEKLILKDEGTQTFSSTFTACAVLKNIAIEGTIGKAISFVDSPTLTTESVQSIIDHLKDLTGQTAQTLTFHATVGGKLTQEQKATVTAKNWALVY